MLLVLEHKAKRTGKSRMVCQLDHYGIGNVILLIAPTFCLCLSCSQMLVHNQPDKLPS